MFGRKKPTLENAAEYKTHKRAHFWFGSIPQWMQHKTNCTVCSGYEQAVNSAGGK